MTICRVETMPKRARMNSGSVRWDAVTGMHRSRRGATTASSSLLRFYVDALFFRFCQYKLNLYSRDYGAYEVGLLP